MCGIIGYTGPDKVKNILLEGLAQLEYRGYDSAGIAIAREDGSIYVEKQTGQTANLKAACEQSDADGHCGIGHTRWATHGGVTRLNTHPHRAGKVTLIHNGIIENYHELIEEYQLQDQLVSETDSEVAAALLNRFYDGTNPKEAIKKTVALLEGSFAFCILFEGLTDRIYCIRSVSPLVASSTEHGSLVASDITAVIKYSRKYFVVPEHQLMILYPDHIDLLNEEGIKTEPEILEVNWDVESAQKMGFPHYMMKEIHEQPEAIRKTIAPRLKNGVPSFEDEGMDDSVFASFTNINVVACGTAMYAGMVGKAVIEPIVKIPVTVQIASEFRYSTPLINENTLTIVVSQSGETIDTLAALRLARSCGSKTLAIVNVKGSSIARESDYVLYTHAGPEIAVASTKAYSVQLSAFYLLACKIAMVRGIFDHAQAKDFINNLYQCIDAISGILEQKDQIREAAKCLENAEHAYYIGRGLDYAFSMEGALKLKEISYVHAEAYAAGELKHGTIALIEKNIPVVAFATQDSVYNKTISNIREVKARGAYVLLITKENAEIPAGVCDMHLTVPIENDLFTGLPTVVILQLLAYYTSLSKGLDVDKPRNLAKSVTVE
ncbi:MAG: glutamine--fructose-6-phosphate transaminase (isomerizing) [Lachnospiraceae bacterium]|nr:glutamine--fructose-6-phosphate transaminase (isomerizing) [Lachnospiraceae bacterium]